VTAERLRLFVAADVPADHLERVAEVSEGLRARVPGGRWTAPENQHLTLKFLGSTPGERLDDVRAAIADVAGRHRPARVSLTAVGAFPSPRRARVVWIGVDDPGGLLPALAGDLERVLEPLGYPAERRAFTPHVTLARFATPARLDAPPDDAVDAPPFSVDEIVLYRSRLSRAGARYEPLSAHALDG
jgi:2'-5' RNA ligase